MRTLRLLSLAFVMLLSLKASAVFSISSTTTLQLCKNNSSTEVDYWVNLNGWMNGCTVDVYFSDGTSETLPVNGVQLHGVHTFKLEGVYTIYFVLKENGIVTSKHKQEISTYCSYVNVKAFFDENNNCIMDPTEKLLKERIDIDITNNGNVKHASIIGGYMPIATAPNETYDLQVVKPAFAMYQPCGGGSYNKTYTAPAGSNNDAVFIGMNCGANPQFDLKTSVKASYRRIGVSGIMVNCSNISCGDKTAQVVVNFDPRYDFKSASVTPVSTGNGTATFSLASLSMKKAALLNIAIQARPGAIINVGEKAFTSAMITPSINDYNPNNNGSSDTCTVINSYDPNSIDADPTPFLNAGKKLTYTVHFENLGSDTAFNVLVLDTLSDNLDISTFQFLSSSHEVVPTIVDGANGVKVARFEFRDINLADSTDKLNNKGYFMYSINAKSTLTAGTHILNRAAIYFDVNPAIMTNTADNMIVPVNVTGIETTQGIKVYPNPAFDVLHIDLTNKTYNELQVLNTLGQVMLTQTISSSKTEVPVQQLAPGIYQLILRGDNGVEVMKFQKQ